MKAIYISPKIKVAQVNIPVILNATSLTGSDTPVDAGDARSKYIEGTFNLDEVE